MRAEGDVSAAAGYRYSVYLLYWYKSTNTDAERAAVKAVAGKLREPNADTDQILGSSTSIGAGVTMPHAPTCAISFRSIRPAGGR
jgi:hypothetical protein